jgi:hypothetical protein
MLRLFEQILQLKESNLQMQLPEGKKKVKSDCATTPETETAIIHRHELLDRVIQPPRKQRRFFGGVVRLCDVHRVLGRKRVGRDETRIKPTDIQTKPVRQNTHHPRVPESASGEEGA